MASITSKMKKNAERICQSALDFARKNGADQAKVVYSIERDQRLSSENAELNLAQILWSQSFAIQVFVGQKKGTASINSIDDGEVENAIMQAISLARFSVKDEYLGLPHKSEIEGPKLKKLKHLYDRSVSSVTLKELKSLAHLGMKTITADRRVKLDRFDISSGESFYMMCTSEGILRTEQSSSIDWDYLAMGVEKGDVGGMDYGGSFASNLNSARSAIKKESDRLRKKIIGGLSARPCPHYRGAVILSPRAVEELLLETILYHASGSQIMDGKSRWQLSQQVASPLLSIRDEPWEPSLSGSTAFDGDGHATEPRWIIKDGVLATIFLDAYSARRLGQKINGTAGGPFGLVIQHGNEALKDVINQQKTTLIVDRFSGNLDPLTGDFSGVAKNSQVYRQKKASPVRETMIAGNVFDILQRCVAVSKETENVSGSYLSPYLMVEGISVSS